MANGKAEPWIIFLIVFIFLVGIYLIVYPKNNRDGFIRFGGPPYTSSCEFQPACLWDTARWVQLSNGMQGVCTLHGIACPSFSTDHDRMRNMGLSPTMVADNYMKELSKNKREKYGGGGGDYDEDDGGDYDEVEGYYYSDYDENDEDDMNTAMGLGMYPTSSG